MNEPSGMKTPSGAMPATGKTDESGVPDRSGIRDATGEPTQSGSNATPGKAETGGVSGAPCPASGGFEPRVISDLDLIVRLRLDFIVEMQPCGDPDKIRDLEAVTRDYFERLIARNAYIGYAGFLDGKPVCCAGLLVYDLPPFVHKPIRRQGHVLNVYTYPACRNRGYSRSLMKFLIADARSKGITRLFLNATKMGEPLYRKLGFAEQEEKALLLNL